jgi:hypothetical protein
MALESTESLREMSARVPPWEARAASARADNFTTFMCRLSRNSGSLKLLGHKGPIQACTGIGSPFYCHLYTSSCKVHVIVLKFLDRFGKNIQISNFIKNSSVEDELFNGDRQTDRQYT